MCCSKWRSSTALNPELVAAVSGSESAWRRLVQEGRLEHFLVPLDEERYWFRLHHLLLEYLRARQREIGRRAPEHFMRARPPGLHPAASFWKQCATAIRRRRRFYGAVALVERSGGWEMVLFGGTVRMRALIGALPADRIAEFPRMQVFQAFVASKEGDLARGIRIFDSVACAHAGTQDPALARDLLAVGHLLGRYADRPVKNGDLAQLYREIDSLPAGR